MGRDFVVEGPADHFTLVKGAVSLADAKELALGHRSHGSLACSAEIFSGRISKTIDAPKRRGTR